MKAVVLAGGPTYRGGFPLNSKPKCLYHVGGEIILGRIIRCLRLEDIHDIRVVTGYRKEDIEQYNQVNQLNLDLVYAHTWKTDAMESLRVALNDTNDDILLMYGDILLRRDVVRGFLDCVEPLAWVYTLTPYCDPINELQDGHRQICVIKVAKEKLHIFDDMEQHWQSFIKRRPRYAKFGPESPFIFDGVMAEALYAHRPIGRVRVEFVRDVDWYHQTDEAPWHTRHMKKIGSPIMKLVRNYLNVEKRFSEGTHGNRKNP